MPITSSPVHSNSTVASWFEVGSIFVIVNAIVRPAAIRLTLSTGICGSETVPSNPTEKILS